MKLVPEISWRGAGRESVPVDTRLLPLLREIRGRATLSAAVGAVGMSYRGAWELLRIQARALGAPLVAMQRGRGARLALLGEQLVAADDAARLHLEPSRARLSVKVGIARRGSATRLRAAASHDLLLAEFCAASLDLVFRGSLESVGALARGEADLAGFHLPADAHAIAPYRALLAPRRDRLIRFAARDQGLMLAPGNPKSIRNLADVAKRHLRFVNRQRGSGTRQLIDQLLRQSGVDPGSVKGYAEEEFTHVAVAATVAAGRADAAVGVRAAAVRFGLTFVPVSVERYWLVVRLRALGDVRMQRLVESLQGDQLKRLAKRLSGYDVRGAGEILPLSALHEAAP